jgi:GNAT superfamily N-acetyltransferase
MRRGVGRALVADAVEFARSRAVSRIEVTANPHALSFYENEGFIADHDTETRFGPSARMHLAVL